MADTCTSISALVLVIRESQQDDEKDPKRAGITEEQNSALLRRLVTNGTTTALFFGTLRKESTLKLAQQLKQADRFLAPNPYIIVDPVQTQQSPAPAQPTEHSFKHLQANDWRSDTSLYQAYILQTASCIYIFLGTDWPAVTISDNWKSSEALIACAFS